MAADKPPELCTTASTVHFGLELEGLRNVPCQSRMLECRRLASNTKAGLRGIDSVMKLSRTSQTGSKLNVSIEKQCKTILNLIVVLEFFAIFSRLYRVLTDLVCATSESLTSCIERLSAFEEGFNRLI